MKFLILVAVICVKALESAEVPDTLQLVHVIFRDGNRTPSKPWKSNPYYDESFYEPYGYGQLTNIFRDGNRTPSKPWKTNPYYNASFYQPYGYGQLTNEGKNTEYELGLSLRKRYGDFLGDKWDINLYDAWSTNYNRTKMSLSLVLAGLFPPNGSTEWNPNLSWQPAPYNYQPVSQDLELSSYACPTVVPLIFGSDENIQRLKEYDPLIEALSNGTGQDVDYLDALDIYITLQLQEHLGLELEEWTKAIYPEPLKSFYVDFYYIETSTPELKKILGGYLLKKIITDTQSKVNGNLTPEDRKIFLYSSHEHSIAFTLVTTNTYNITECPPFGSHILVEVHNIDGVHGIKLFYQDNKTEEPQSITLPGCDEFCPLDDFVSLTADLIPQSSVDCYGSQ